MASSKIVEVQDRPDLYDWQYDHTDDVRMYHDLAERHDILLECGIGTGRVAIPLAKSGKTVYGIDNSRHMLDHLEKKLSMLPDVYERVKCVEADMRDFNLEQQFSFIYVPFSTFNYLLTIEDQRKALGAIRKHLTDDGILVLEILSFSFHPRWLDNTRHIEEIKKGPFPETEEEVHLQAVTEFDSSTQIVVETRFFSFFDQNGNLTGTEKVVWRNRYFPIGEMRLLLESCGFALDALYGDWKMGEYCHESEFAVLIAKPK
ncbi:MAG: class I SAM-dependent methyltransferase [Candidatus Bathyarchaeia archaeon]